MDKKLKTLMNDKTVKKYSNKFGLEYNHKEWFEKIGHIMTEDILYYMDDHPPFEILYQLYTFLYSKIKIVMVDKTENIYYKKTVKNILQNNIRDDNSIDIILEYAGGGPSYCFKQYEDEIIKNIHKILEKIINVTTNIFNPILYVPHEYFISHILQNILFLVLSLNKNLFKQYDKLLLTYYSNGISL